MRKIKKRKKKPVVRLHPDRYHNATGEELLVVCYGVGLDSTCLIVEMFNRGLRPDLILFADTGGEKPGTYAYIHIMNAWLKKVGFPQITIVKYEPVTAPYETLEEKCAHNETLPSIAFGKGKHSCAIVFKRDPQVKFLKNWQPALDAISSGRKILKAIGYDDGDRDNVRRIIADDGTDKIHVQIDKRSACGRKPLASQWEAAHCDFWYPLQEWHLDREALPDIIKAAGLPVPEKSACFYCPSSQPSEVVELKLKYPDLYERAVKMENRARSGKHGLTSNRGLSISQKWAFSDLRGCDDPEQAKEYLKQTMDIEGATGGDRP